MKPLSLQPNLPARPHQGGVPGERLQGHREGQGGQVQEAAGQEEEEAQQGQGPL